MINVGLGVDQDCVRAVLVRSGKAVWAKESIIDGSDQLASAVTSLLLSAPLPRLQPRRVSVAIGPTHSQVRRINGLPPSTDTTVLARVVHQGITRFFVKSETPVLATGVQLIEPGSVWGCSIDAGTVDAITAGCRAARVRLVRVVPAVAVLGHGLDNEDVCWECARVHLHLEFNGGTLTSLRRLRGVAGAGCAAPRPKAGLNSAGEDAWRFADAYGAAMAPPALPLTLPRSLFTKRNVRSARGRLVVAGVVFATATCSALMAPILAATRAGRRAEQVLAALATDKASADTVHQDMRRMTSAINAVADFAASRRSITLLLKELATALPERTALAALRVDSAGGTLVALGPQAAQVVTALEQLALIASPEITGPITRELLGTEFVERVTVRFRLADSVPAALPKQTER